MIPEDYDALFEQATDRPPFANSDEGVPWMSANCGTCAYEQPTRDGDDQGGCPLVLIALVGRTPRQWTPGPRGPRGLYARETQWVCGQYRPTAAGPDPRPLTTLPGQGELIPDEAVCSVRP